MSSVVIVALPEQESFVHKVSSEKKPHMTLLFLGELEEGPELAHIESYVAHIAATTMLPFGAEVKNRGLLGDDDADVLFFRKSELANVERARQNMLNDSTIRLAYENADQYPSWTPHLTLGYPETPAKDKQEDMPHHGYVFFDKLALWFGDSEGPEFDLGDREESGRLMMSAEDLIEDTLQHYGVKGMKWGVRRSESNGGFSLPKEAPSSDAKNKHTQQARIKRSGTDALSNKELKDLNERLNLEQNYNRMTSSESGLKRIQNGQTKIKAVINVVKTIDEVRNVMNSPTLKQIRKTLG